MPAKFINVYSSIVDRVRITMQRIVLYFLIAAITLLPLAGHAMSLTAHIGS